MRRLSVLCALCSVLFLAACGGGSAPVDGGPIPTPTVDYIEGLDVYSSPVKDSFLNQLAMNYRSFAIYNARTSGFPDIGELFAQKAVAAFSGDTPVPESLESWHVDHPEIANELDEGYRQMTDMLRNDGAAREPLLMAEAQAKFDCWVSSAASGQMPTALECRNRFDDAMAALSGNFSGADGRGGNFITTLSSGGGGDSGSRTTTIERYTLTQPGQPGALAAAAAAQPTAPVYYPETSNMRAMTDRKRSRDGIVIVNNVNIPEHLIKPEPVRPFVFNQNIVQGPNGGEPVVTSGPENPEPAQTAPAPAPVMQPAFVAVPTYIPAPGNDNLITREEFTTMIMQLRAEMEQIRLAMAQQQAGFQQPQPQQQPSSAPMQFVQQQGPTTMDKTIIKIQQIPLEQNQAVMEEVLEIFFDFDKYVIKPEYEDIIRQLSRAAQSNRNIKVTVVGHTDTKGSDAYNFALGGRRAQAVRKVLIEYGIPSSQIVAVSAGESDLKVQTGDNVKEARNRRATIIKETSPDENGIATPNPVTVDFKTINKTITQGGSIQPQGAAPVGAAGGPGCGATRCPPRPIQEFEVFDAQRPIGSPTVIYK
ncbi:hypothetical protein FACS189421_02590 [Bacteroidia bacterium]|nr:hypothetical protein FACS189421_02590 [Bacteroidia bacterium]